MANLEDEVMRTFSNFLMAALLGLVVMLGAGSVLAHDPTPDMGKGKVVGINAWCKDLADVYKVFAFMHARDTEGLIKFYLADGNSCHNVKVMRSVTRQPIPNPRVELIEVMGEVEAPDGMVGSIVNVKNASGGTVYTWHHWRPNDA